MKIVGSYIGAHDVGFSLIENNQILAMLYRGEIFTYKICICCWSISVTIVLKQFKKILIFDIKDPNVKFVVAKLFYSS